MSTFFYLLIDKLNLICRQHQTSSLIIFMSFSFTNLESRGTCVCIPFGLLAWFLLFWLRKSINFAWLVEDMVKVYNLVFVICSCMDFVSSASCVCNQGKFLLILFFDYVILVLSLVLILTFIIFNWGFLLSRLNFNCKFVSLLSFCH